MAKYKTKFQEYKKEYVKAQKDGAYKMFYFDVQGSRIHSVRDKELFYQSLTEFVNKSTKDLLELEKLRGTEILHRNMEIKDLDINSNKKVENTVILAETQEEIWKVSKNVLRVDSFNPIYWMADAMHFIVNRDSISDEEFMSILQKNKDELIPNYDLHMASAYYETDVWIHEPLSRVYCIPILDELSKLNKNKFKTEDSKKNIIIQNENNGNSEDKQLKEKNSKNKYNKKVADESREQSI